MMIAHIQKGYQALKSKETPFEPQHMIASKHSALSGVLSYMSINICMLLWTCQKFHLCPHWTVMMYVLNSQRSSSLEIGRPARFPVRFFMAGSELSSGPPKELTGTAEEIRKDTASHIMCNGKPSKRQLPVSMFRGYPLIKQRKL